MRIRDSGMPEESYWETLFDVPLILSALGIDRFHDVAELGCGYGTFTIPIAKVISGAIRTFDIDPKMVDRTNERAAGLPVIAEVRDVIQEGFGVTADAVLLFNILHCENPRRLFEHAVQRCVPTAEFLSSTGDMAKHHVARVWISDPSLNKSSSGPKALTSTEQSWTFLRGTMG